jgi:hypothetical protein
MDCTVKNKCISFRKILFLCIDRVDTIALRIIININFRQRKRIIIEKQAGSSTEIIIKEKESSTLETKTSRIEDEKIIGRRRKKKINTKTSRVSFKETYEIAIISKI